MTKISRRVPIMNSHPLKSTVSLVFVYEYNYNATTILPKMDMPVPTIRCTRLELNIWTLSRLVTI